MKNYPVYNEHKIKILLVMAFLMLITGLLLLWRYSDAPVGKDVNSVSGGGIMKEFPNSPSSAVMNVPARDYQLEVNNDSIYIYDGYRIVGGIIFNNKEAIGTLIESDNK